MDENTNESDDPSACLDDQLGGDQEVRGLAPQIGVLSAPECRGQRAGRTYSCMPPGFRVEPLQSIADDPAVRNDHLSRQRRQPLPHRRASDWRQRTPCPWSQTCAATARVASRPPPFPLNLNRTDRDILAFGDRVDNRTPPPLWFRR